MHDIGGSRADCLAAIRFQFTFRSVAASDDSIRLRDAIHYQAPLSAASLLAMPVCGVTSSIVACISDTFHFRHLLPPLRNYRNAHSQVLGIHAILPGHRGNGNDVFPAGRLRRILVAFCRFSLHDDAAAITFLPHMPRPSRHRAIGFSAEVIEGCYYTVTLTLCFTSCGVKFL